MSYFLNAITQHYADLSGRATRKEYWMYTLFAGLSGYVAMLMDRVLGTTISPLGSGWIHILLVLALFLPGLGMLVRRLHDVGRSGWFSFIVLIPIAGVIWLFVLMCRVSEPSDNVYGKNPLRAIRLSNAA